MVIDSGRSMAREKLESAYILDNKRVGKTKIVDDGNSVEKN